MSESVLVSTPAEGVLEVRLNRPERRNGLVPEMMEGLAEAFQQPAAAYLLTAERPAFCVGADLKWVGEQSDPGEAIGRLVGAFHEVIRAMRAAPGPIVAAINGAAAGGGWSLALAADYRIASEEASFTAAYFRLGLTPDGGSTIFLGRALGAARTMDLLLTNRRVSAAEARDLGVVNLVVGPEWLAHRSLETAKELSSLSGEAVLAGRRLLDAASSTDFEGQLDAEEQAMRTAARDPRFEQALRAFLSR
jgi:2-(1,2-epoxy-1,2-dihydrophenyl)acetyl-CoA isomerase